MAEEQSLITDEHRALIGQKSEPAAVTVRGEDAHRMRDVLADGDARYADDTGVAPPYVIAMLGSGGRRGPGVQILPNALLTQQEWRFTRPFRVGEMLSAVNQIVDIRERLGGRYGHSILVTTATDYYDGGGDHVAASLITITQFDPKGARASE